MTILQHATHSLLRALVATGVAASLCGHSYAAVTEIDNFVLDRERDIGLFSNVTLVELEMETPGVVRLEVRKDGKVMSNMDVSSHAVAHGGWSTFDFSSGMNPPVIPGWSPYSLYLVNPSGDPKKVTQVNVHGEKR
jgi:hypothetical protein